MPKSDQPKGPKWRRRPRAPENLVGSIMNDDLFLDWTPVTLDIGGQPANVQGYRIYDMSGASPSLVADVSSGPTTLVGYVTDPNAQYPVSVSAYNSAGEGPLSSTVVPSPPSQSVPSQVTGLSATIIPK